MHPRRRPLHIAMFLEIRTTLCYASVANDVSTAQGTVAVTAQRNCKGNTLSFLLSAVRKRVFLLFWWGVTEDDKHAFKV